MIGIKLLLLLGFLVIVSFVYETIRGYLSIFFIEEEETNQNEYLKKPIFNYLTVLANINFSLAIIFTFLKGMDTIFIALLSSSIFLVSVETLFAFNLFTTIFGRES